MRGVIAGLIVALLAPTIPVAAQEPADGAKVYRQAIPSVVWIHSDHGGGRATGSGSLVDRGRRLVITNYHVVGDNPKATVYFPVFRDSRPIPEREYYLERSRRLGVAARVLALDKKADLAVLQLESVPETAAGIVLAADSPDPGETVHSVGNAGQSGALWGYVRGTVRQVYHKSWRARLGPTQVASFEAKVIETDSPTNPGDSGGPLLDDRGQLVGVTQGGAVEAQSLSYFVDVSEVKQLLTRREVRDLPGGKRAAAPTPIRDQAKLFSQGATNTASKVIEELFHRGLGVQIETYAVAPDEWVAQARKATPEMRQKLFRTWAADRAKQAHAEGIMILVCLDPRYILVDIPSRWEGRFPSGFAQQVADTLIRGFQAKDYDAGLTRALTRIRDQYQEVKK